MSSHVLHPWHLTMSGPGDTAVARDKEWKRVRTLILLLGQLSHIRALVHCCMFLGNNSQKLKREVAPWLPSLGAFTQVQQNVVKKANRACGGVILGVIWYISAYYVHHHRIYTCSTAHAVPTYPTAVLPRILGSCLASVWTSLVSPVVHQRQQGRRTCIIIPMHR